MRLTFMFSLIFFAMMLVACGGDSEKGDDGGAPSTASSTQDIPSDGGDPASSKGIGPISHVDLASIDPSMAPKGGEVFEAKCTACHKMEERYVGPALKGVTKRRTPEWIMNMILNPDVMTKEDPAAKQLFAQFLAPMTNQNLTEEEARLVLTFFLEYDKNVTE